jgi:Zn finger protein HypA/HybF involved in hydrogenase expression
MSNVISIQEKMPHNSGPAKCLNCNHEFVAVAPVGAVSFECPSCLLHKAVFAGVACPPEDDLVFRCNCGNENFNVLTYGVFCIQCGLSHHFKDLCP